MRNDQLQIQACGCRYQRNGYSFSYISEMPDMTSPELTLRVCEVRFLPGLAEWFLQAWCCSPASTANQHPSISLLPRPIVPPLLQCTVQAVQLPWILIFARLHLDNLTFQLHTWGMTR